METLLEERQLIDCIRTEADEIQEFRVADDDSAQVKAQKETKLAERKLKEAQCKSLLVEKIADSQLEYIKGKSTPKAIWATLQNVFAKKGISGQFYLLKQLAVMKYNEAEPMEEHLLKFDRIIRELATAEITMHDRLVVFNLLQTMPRSFQQLVTVLETLPPEQCTLDFVKARLLSESIKRKNNFESEGVSTDEAAFYGGRVKNSKLKCFACGKVGHKKADCPARPKGQEDRQKPGRPKQKERANVADSEVAFVTQSGCEAEQQREFKWILDSGASEHMVHTADCLRDVKKLETPVPIMVASGKVVHSNYSGTVDMELRVGERRIKSTVNEVLYVPELQYNLFSIRRVGKLGMRITFERDQVKIVRNDEVVAVGSVAGKLYVLNAMVKRGHVNEALVSSSLSQYELWHRRFGHIGKSGLRKLVRDDMVKGVTLKSEAFVGGEVCEPCMMGKHARQPFDDVPLPRSKRPLELVHSDVCGAFTPAAWNGKRFFVTFTDDFTHFCAVYLLTTKDEVFEAFQQYTSMAENHFDRKIARIRCDNGGEYVSNDFSEYCKANGVTMEKTIPYTPQQNGVSERLNRTILDRARAMVHDAGVTKRLWGEAVQAAVYVINRSPTAALQKKTPYEMWYGHKPDVSKLRIWGSKAYSFIPKEKRTKLDARSEACYFVGYGPTGYRLWNHQKQKVYLARDVVVNETWNEADNDHVEEEVESDHPVWTAPAEQVEVQEPDADDPVVDDAVQSDDDEFLSGEDETDAENETDVRKSTRVRNPPQRYGDYTCLAYALNAENYVQNLPDSIEEMKLRDDWPHWRKAVEEELKSLTDNKTWELVDLPDGRRPVDCKWVFKLKLNPDSSIQKYKARLVAKGFTQRYGYDFTETYAPVVRMSTVRMMLALANQENLLVHQMDVKTAFLNGTLAEEIYMRQPRGFEEGNRVCKLNKSIYGLKQASKAWNDRFHEFVSRIGFKRCINDNCLYVNERDGEKVFLLLYVDDILVICRSLNLITTIKKLLKNEFAMQDMGEATVFLGLKIDRDILKGQMKLSQEHYAKLILKRFGMEECKPVATPMESNLQLKKSEQVSSLQKPYRELIGCLTYLMVTSRPDLSASVSYFSQFQSNPTEEHWTHAKRILRYIRGTADHGMVYQRTTAPDQIVGYADASWAADLNDRRSVSGILFKVYGAVTSWSSKKQSTVSLSSTEAECSALADATCEAIWIQKLFEELGILNKRAARIYEDNQSTIAVIKSPGNSKRLKHTDVKLHFVRDCVAANKIEIQYIPTNDQQADLLTKGLPTAAFRKHCKSIGISRCPEPRLT